MSTGKRAVRKNIHPYLSDKLYSRFKGYCKKMGVTESSVVEEALSQYLDEKGDMAVVLKKMNRQVRSLDRVNRDVKVLSEAFSVFVQLWFAHTPKVSEEDKDVAQHEAFVRYRKYLDFVGEQLGGGHTFIDDLTREEPLTDEEEMQRLIQEDSDDEYG